jgi:hypothetical protein
MLAAGMAIVSMAWVGIRLGSLDQDMFFVFHPIAWIPCTIGKASVAAALIHRENRAASFALFAVIEIVFFWWLLTPVLWR